MLQWMLGCANSGPWLLCWSGCRVSLSITTQTSSLALPLLAHPMQAAASSGASCPVLRSSDLGHSRFHHQGQLYYFAQARFRTISPDCCRGNMRGCGGSSLLSSSQGWLTDTPDNRVSSNELSRQHAGPALLGAAASERQDWFSHSQDPQASSSSYFLLPQVA